MHQNAISEAELTEGQFRYGRLALLAYVDLKRVVPLMVGGNRRVDKTLRVIREVLEGSMGQPYAGPNHPNITMLDDDTFHIDNAHRIMTFGLVVLSMPPFQSMSEGPSCRTV